MNEKSYWWVNQGKAYEIQRDASFLWSPKHEKSGRSNRGFSNMAKVEVGDIFFVNNKSSIAAVGLISSKAYEAERPLSFPTDQNPESPLGWRVDAEYFEIPHSKRVSISHLQRLFDYTPAEFSPFGIDKKAKQKLYLNELRKEDGLNLLKQLTFSKDLLDKSYVTSDFFNYEDEVMSNSDIETTRQRLVDVRSAQQKFRANVENIEKYCRVTKIDNRSLLIASHIKPWRWSSNGERIDGNNGLLLTPSIDKLFDRFFISFENNGDVLISHFLSEIEKEVFGLIDCRNVGGFNNNQIVYLEFHREKFHELNSFKVYTDKKKI